MSKSRAQIVTEIGTNLPDNTTGAITPAILRNTLLDVVSTALAGGTVFVDNALGDDSTGAVHDVALPFKTLAAAVTAAGSGDTIIVRAGSYVPTTNLAKNGVSWFFQQGAKITFAPANPTVALWDLVDASATFLNVDGFGEFTVSATGTRPPGFGALVYAGNADASVAVALSSFGVFRCRSILDTTGAMLAVCYNSATVNNFLFAVDYLTASVNLHGIPTIRIGVWKLLYGKIDSDNCTVSGDSWIGYFSDIIGDHARGLVIGDYLKIDYFFNGTLNAHACKIVIGQTNKNSQQLCQVWVTEGPTHIVGDLRTLNNPGQAAPLVIASPDPVTYEGTIEMFDCDYSFPVDIKTNGAQLNLNRATFIQNLTGDGTVRIAVYGVTAVAPYAIFTEPGVTATVSYRNQVVANHANFAGLTEIGPAMVVDAGLL